MRILGTQLPTGWWRAELRLGDMDERREVSQLASKHAQDVLTVEVATEKLPAG